MVGKNETHAIKMWNRRAKVKKEEIMPDYGSWTEEGVF